MRPALALLVLVAAVQLASAQSFRDEILEVHNTERATVVPAASPALAPIQWDDELASLAQDYVNGCPVGHGNRGYGENLAWGTTDTRSLALLWVNEKHSYDYHSNTCLPGEVCGHYTQMVWANSVRLGCAVNPSCANKFSSGVTHNTMICYYDPPGNYIGQWPYAVSSAASSRCSFPCGETCGVFACGGVEYECGCPAGSACYDGECCEPTRTSCSTNECGSIWNGCEWMECGACLSGSESCVSNECQPIESCPDALECSAFDGSLYECGSVSNNCGSVITCGTCPTGTTCVDFQCTTACEGACGAGETCNIETNTCICQDGFTRVSNSQCAPIPSGTAQASGEWEAIEGDGVWRVQGDELVAANIQGVHRVLWLNSNNSMEEDSTISMEFGGVQVGDSVIIGFRYDIETLNSLEVEVSANSNGLADVSFCYNAFGSRDCLLESFCSDKAFAIGDYTRVDVRSRVYSEGLEVSVAIGGEYCSTLITMDLTFINALFFSHGHAYAGFNSQGSRTVAIRNAAVVTTNTISVSLNDCVTSEQWMQYVTTVLNVPRENVVILDMGDSSGCGERKRAEVLGGLGSGITFQVVGTASKSSAALSSQFMSATAAGAQAGAAVGGAVNGVALANGAVPGAVGAGSFGTASAVAVAPAAGGGGGGGGGLGTGAIVAMSIAIPTGVLALLIVGVVVGAAAYKAMRGNDETSSSSSSVDSSSEPSGRRSMSQRIRGFFGVRVMGGDGKVHQSITARSPPQKV